MALITLDEIQALPTVAGYSTANTTLRIWYNRNFQDGSGTAVFGGNGATGFYISVPCTVSDDGITPDESPQIYSTVDALDPAPQSIQCFARFFSNGSPKDWLFQGAGTPLGWVVYNPDPSTSVTFAQLQLLNQAQYIAYPPTTFPTTPEMIAYVNSVSGDTSYAGVNTLGQTYVSVAPTTVTHPIAVEDNDTRLISSLTYAALALITAITGVIKFCSDRLKGLYYKTSASIWCSLTGRASVLDHGCVGDGSTDCRSALNTLFNTTLATTGGIVRFPHYQNAATTNYLIGSDLTIPANIILDLEPGAMLKVATGVTVTDLAYIPLSPFQIFNLVGTGVVSFAGNTKLYDLGGKWWGAVGDGSTNDRTSIQSAVTAAGTLGSARICFPNGIYLITGTPTGTAGHKALILLPTIAFAGNEPIVIEIAGPPLPNGAFGTVVTTYQPTTKACIFKTTTNTDALFGGSNGTDFTAASLKMTNCLVRLPDNPSITGVDGRLLGGLFLDWFGVDTGRYTTSIVQATDGTQAGVKTPQNANAGDTWLGHIYAQGCYYGATIYEHTSGDYLILNGNAVGLGFQTSDHASYFKRVEVFNNTVNIQVNGVHYFTIEQLDIEHAQGGVGGVPAWQSTTWDYNDVLNQGHGQIKTQLVVAGTGIPANWAAELKTNGASGIKERWVGYPDYITRLTLNTPQTLTTNVEAAAIFNVVGEDPYGLYAAGTPTIITVTRTDTYLICWSVDFAANATGNRTINFGLNGVTTIPGANFLPATVAVTTRNAGCVYYPLTAGDTVDMRLKQTSGGNLDVTQALFSLQRQ